MSRTDEILQRVKYVEEQGGLRTREVVNMACADSRWLLERNAALESAFVVLTKALEAARLEAGVCTAERDGKLYEWVERHNAAIAAALAEAERLTRGTK